LFKILPLKKIQKIISSEKILGNKGTGKIGDIPKDCIFQEIPKIQEILKVPMDET
jgi:hypothetical protein